MKPQKNYLDFYKKIYRDLKRKADAYEDSTSKELKSYRKNAQKYYQRSFDLSNEEELFHAIEDAEYIFIGDFHTFDQNSKNVLRILRYLKEKKYRVTLALEMVDHEDQEQIDFYLDGVVTELEFLTAINYHESWRFPWSHYREIFHQAKKEENRILAINSKGTLRQRDKFAAKSILEYKKNKEGEKLIIFFGEYHLAPNKLPSLIKENNKEILIIHQNIDEVFWKLATRTIPTSTIIKFNKDEFSLISSPAWIKYESLLYWLENTAEDPDFDYHQLIIETGKKALSSNAWDQFYELCLELLNILDLSIDRFSDIDNFKLYDFTKLESVLSIVNNITNKKLASLYEANIRESSSFHIIGSNVFYFPNYSINRMSIMAGIHLFHSYIKKKEIFLDSKSLNTNSQLFILLFWQHFFGHFASKIINPSRKLTTISQLRNCQDDPNAQKTLDIVIYKKLELLKGLRGHQLDMIASLSSALSVGVYFDYLSTLEYEESLQKFKTMFNKLNLSQNYFTYFLEEISVLSKAQNKKKSYF